METEQVDLMRSMVIVLRQAIRLREQLDVTKAQMAEMREYNNAAVEKLMSQLNIVKDAHSTRPDVAHEVAK